MFVCSLDVLKIVDKHSSTHGISSFFDQLHYSSRLLENLMNEIVQVLKGVHCLLHLF